MYIMGKVIRKILLTFSLDEGAEVIDREVKPFGNSGHIIIPDKHIGKKVTIICAKKFKTRIEDDKKK